MADEPLLAESEGCGPVRPDDLIDEAGRESFPASDPPATWSGVDRRDRVDEAGGSTPESRGTGSD